MNKVPKGQRGVVMITIMIVMLVSMLLGSALVNHFAVQESRAVELLLASARANWAMFGHLNYVLSRAWNAHNSLCGGAGCDVFGDTPDNDDNARITSVQNILTELQTEGGTIRRWSFDNRFYIDVQAMASDPNPASDDGALRLRLTLQTIGGSASDFGDFSQLPASVALDQYSGLDVPDVWTNFCFYNSPAACPTEAAVPDNAEFGRNLITGLFRVQP